MQGCRFSMLLAGLLLAGFAGAANPPKSPYGMVRLLSLACHKTVVKLLVSTQEPAAEGDKLHPKAVMAANPRQTLLPAQQVMVNLAGKGKQRLAFRTAAGAPFEVILEVIL